MMESTCIMSGHKGPVNSLVLLETEEVYSLTYLSRVIDN